ncbi:MAG TPA: EamA family transporter [Candidatus Moranbacteria bacterium]|nr:EamA family transporter [Candidatus Moranbacteria bacterium]
MNLVANVFALKRTMPIFAAIIGVLYFKEEIGPKKALAILMMVAGSVVIYLFQ